VEQQISEQKHQLISPCLLTEQQKLQRTSPLKNQKQQDPFDEFRNKKKRKIEKARLDKNERQK
jgi:hypothetical protein